MENTTTIKCFRPHPLYILSNLWRYLFILLIPLVRGLYYVVINSFSLTNGFQFAVNISRWGSGRMDGYLFLLCFLSLGILLWVSLYSRGVRRRTAGKQGDFSQGDKLPACVQIQLCIAAGATAPSAVWCSVSSNRYAGGRTSERRSTGYAA